MSDQPTFGGCTAQEWRGIWGANSGGPESHEGYALIEALTEIERLTAYAEGLEADARRYRFLRDAAYNLDAVPYVVTGPHGATEPITGAELDKAIDERPGVGNDSLAGFIRWLDTKGLASSLLGWDEAAQRFTVRWWAERYAKERPPLYSQPKGTP